MSDTINLVDEQLTIGVATGAALVHTGEVTGSGALTVDPTAISNKPEIAAKTGDFVLVGDTASADALSKVDIGAFVTSGSASVREPEA